MTTERFVQRFEVMEADELNRSINENSETLLREVGVDTYHVPDPSDLPQEVLAQIEAANLLPRRKSLPAFYQGRRSGTV